MDTTTCHPNVGDVNNLPVDKLFSPMEISKRREHLKKVVGKFVDKWYKNKYGDEF